MWSPPPRFDPIPMPILVCSRFVILLNFWCTNSKCSWNKHRQHRFDDVHVCAFVGVFIVRCRFGFFLFVSLPLSAPNEKKISAFILLSIFRVYIFPCNKFQFSEYLFREHTCIINWTIERKASSINFQYTYANIFIIVQFCARSIRVRSGCKRASFLHFRIVCSKRKRAIRRDTERQRNERKMDRVQSYFGKMVLVEWAH